MPFLFGICDNGMWALSSMQICPWPTEVMLIWTNAYLRAENTAIKSSNKIDFWIDASYPFLSFAYLSQLIFLLRAHFFVISNLYIIDHCCSKWNVNYKIIHTQRQSNFTLLKYIIIVGSHYLQPLYSQILLLTKIYF